MHDQTRNFSDWIQDVVAYEFYFSIFINFVATIIVLIIVRQFLFVKISTKQTRISCSDIVNFNKFNLSCIFWANT